MNIPDKFYEDEVREGFYVPASVKQAWGATLIVLSEIDRICKKHNITYFAEWGTFLGALRHGGFIPWDDDLDIGMKRQDYERFLEVAPLEMPEDFQIYNFRTKFDHTGFLANVVGKSRICFEKEHLEKYHGFPFITGIDIFILDNVCRDEKREKDRVNKCRYIIKAADDICDGKITGKAKEEIFDFLNSCGIKIKRSGDPLEQRALMYMAAEKLFMQFSDEESDYMTRMMPNGLEDNNGFLLPKNLLDEYVELSFEGINIPVPAAYDYMMHKRYGDYMRLVKDAGGHGYPYFETQKAALEKTMGFEMPGFKVDKSLIRREEILNNDLEEADDYKSIVLAYIEMILSELDKGRVDLDEDKLASYQEMAIELGTYMESIKGEGYDLVHDLEEFCNVVFELHTALQSGSTCTVDRLVEIISTLKNKVIQRREVLFLPFKSEYWYVFENEYKKAVRDENVDVYVVPIPYYYKEYDGSLRDKQYDVDSYDSSLPLVYYDQYDISIHRPDVIYTQNPYDQYNETISVPELFFSLNLRKYTEELVYIPWFRTDDFTKEIERAYHNMKSYCYMPGVLYSDKIILHSSVIRDRYIEKIVDLLGDDWKELFEKRIIVELLESDNLVLPVCEAVSECSTKEKKNIAYFPDFSMFIEHGEKYLDKIKRTFSIFENNASNIDVYIICSKSIEKYLKQMRPELYASYREIVDTYAESDWCYVMTDDDLDEIVMKCNAFYGDAGVLAHKFRNHGKPVMIENVAI